MNFSAARVLITGGTGSFGNAFTARLLAGVAVGEIRIFSRDEKKQEDMRIAFGVDHRLRFCIGDVRDYDSVHRAMRGVDYVFHAAALKQVPSCEFYPLEAVRTNVLGADHVMNAAIVNGVRRVVVLSTDKAVYPINAMGMSKALMEKLMIARARFQSGDDTVLCATRYGNVMSSRGSVIPLFVQQIQQGKPLTITDARMTRFMMSLEDSIDLVLHALEHGQQGDIFVKKAPAATVGDLAQALKILFDKDSAVSIVGVRPGEKFHESLLSREEMAKAVDAGRYFRVPAADHGECVESDDYTSYNTQRLSVDQLVELLREVPYIQSRILGT